MALSCDASSLAKQSGCLSCLSDKQLLAAIVLLVCSGGVKCDLQSVIKQSGSLVTLTQKQLLSALVLSLCANGAGNASGSCVTGGAGAPSGTPPCKFSIYIQQPGPNFGLWLGDSTGWSNVIAQGP